MTGEPGEELDAAVRLETEVPKPCLEIDVTGISPEHLSQHSSNPDPERFEIDLVLVGHALSHPRCKCPQAAPRPGDPIGVTHAMIERSATATNAYVETAVSSPRRASTKPELGSKTKKWFPANMRDVNAPSV